ncbi:MAG TPA: alpha-glucuronidase family glycosyl hydrolase, partial [Longimicrobium sp.]|nr:alpha-glucuronidase family glycosyl hydrolase [Longimicrobium sp.]
MADSGRLADYRRAIRGIRVEGDSPTLTVVRDELNRGLDGLLGHDVPMVGDGATDGLIIAGTPRTSPSVRGLGLDAELAPLGPDGFILRSLTLDGRSATVIAAAEETGVLYGAFHLLRLLQTEQSIGNLAFASRPRIDLRLLNHWDNLDGSIERGYAGASIWNWQELPGRVDRRIVDYARANASIGINGVVLNNVNADPRILREDYLPRVAAIADALRPYGIRVYLSANFGAPLPPSATPDVSKEWGGIGDLDSADPLDPRVRQWWRIRADEIYRLIPDFGGFLVKANSEGMPGPNDYGRSHAEGANMLAEALAPHGGIVIWRAFVYPSNADPDRAKRAYTEFVPLDGTFRENVLVQPKTGPLDFQPREPFHPLFGAMPRTPLVAELQITQEYLGHATHLVYLAPMWEAVLDADTHARGPGTTVAEIVAGEADGHRRSGMAGVANVGAETNWTGHHFAQANWFAFGRLSWDPELSSAAIAEEWARLTWGNDPATVSTIREMMMRSWPAAANYLSPMALGITVEGGEHYEPRLEGRDGRYWFADREGIGYDRTRTGSGYVDQYRPPLSDRLNDPATTPIDEILWFHRLPWDHRLSSGRTVWEELAFRYVAGVRTVDEMSAAWAGLQGRVDPRRWAEVAERLEAQRAHARVWRDRSLAYFRCRNGRPIPAEALALAASAGDAAALSAPPPAA